MRTLKEMLEERKTSKTPIMLFMDIETFQFNERMIKVEKKKQKPSLLKNMTFSVAVSWLEGATVELEIFPNFKEMFDAIIDVFQGRKTKPRIIINAHNTNKYDNHFLRRDLMHFYPHMQVKNFFLTTAATEEANQDAVKIKDLKTGDKDGIILEKRIKSSINLEMTFFLKGVQFETMDNWMKTNSSVKMLGKKLFRLGVISEDEQKTDFDYLKYNMDEDMSEEEARAYAQRIYENLTPDELTYIANDVIILAKSVYHYSEIFKDFDYKKRTFTSNILDAYNTNPKTGFQLLNRIGEGKNKYEIRYTDYKFAGMNFYDYLKPFYRGGLNFYNQHHKGTTIKSGVFSMDIHSSYPFAMHKFKIPTFIKDYEDFKGIPTIVTVNHSDDEYTLYQLTKKDFDTKILKHIDSMMFKQMLVKYYTTNEYINLNSYTFRMIEEVMGHRVYEIPVLSRITFETDYFGSREQIEKFYEIKTQGKYDKKLEYFSPYELRLTDEENDVLYSEEEVANSKVNLNGLYGIPALRPFFNLFRLDKDGKLYNVPNGHKNAERNIVFSIFVTSVSLWNLLTPLKYLTHDEVDENLLYIDTDSLYMKEAIFHKMPDKLFTKFELGTWGLDYRNLPNFHVLNHKKYAYEAPNKKTGELEIVIKSGGIPHDSFDTDMSFDEFIATQFHHGAKVKTLKSIYNQQGTISLYNADTELTEGSGYRLFSDSKRIDELKEKMFKDIRKQIDEFTDDVQYIESEIGTYSIADLFPFVNPILEKEPLVFLEIKQDKFKELIAVNNC